MDSEQKAGEVKGGCSQGPCCGGKAAAALVLLVVGGMLGYFLGGRGACRQGMMNMPFQSQTK